MTVAHEKDILATTIDHPQVKNAAMKALIGPRQGWSDYVMRVVELDTDGYSPAHAHPWPHINYMLEGKGILLLDGREHPVQAGSYAFVPAGSHHQFKNAGPGKFRFICIVPKEGHQ
ncbi:MAG: cupin domain-containing protein [Desulfobacteraceae bacterium]|nr:MAG: cupin domain-containing protein [Desulfobacteraceae bacterium]